MKKKFDCCGCFRGKNIDHRCTSYTCKTMFARKLLLSMKKGIHIMNPKKEKQYTSPYYFVFYIQYEFM